MRKITHKPQFFYNPNTHDVYNETRFVIKGRWLEAEPIIMKEPKYAYYYALDVIKGRWPEAEPIIMKNPYCACLYARTLIKDRWPESEPIIKGSPYQYLYEYRFKVKL